MSAGGSLVLRAGRSHWWLLLATCKPFVALGRERVLTDPRGFGVYVEWERGSDG